jgi:hypothetical protein
MVCKQTKPSRRTMGSWRQPHMNGPNSKVRYQLLNMISMRPNLFKRMTPPTFHDGANKEWPGLFTRSNGRGVV